MEHNCFASDGHLTDEAFELLRSDAADELSRLEISEHLAFCDDCLDRYSAALTPDVLAEPCELLHSGIFARIRRKSREIFISRYLSAGVAPVSRSPSGPPVSSIFPPRSNACRKFRKGTGWKL